MRFVVRRVGAWVVPLSVILAKAGIQSRDVGRPTRVSIAMAHMIRHSQGLSFFKIAFSCHVRGQRSMAFGCWCSGSSMKAVGDDGVRRGNSGRKAS